MPTTVTSAPASCTSSNVSSSNRYPNKAANIGVKNVKLLSFVRLPLDAK